MNARSKLICGAISGLILGFVLIVGGPYFIVLDRDYVLCTHKPWLDTSTSPDNGSNCIDGLLKLRGKLKSFEKNLYDLL